MPKPIPLILQWDSNVPSHLKNLLFIQDKFTVEQGQGKHSQPMRTEAGSSVSAHQLLDVDKIHIPALTCL